MEEPVRARLIPNGIARRVKAVLLLSAGASLRSKRAATALQLRHLVKWRERFAAQGLEGLVHRPREDATRNWRRDSEASTENL